MNRRIGMALAASVSLMTFATGCGGGAVGNAAVISGTEYKFTIDQPLKPGLNTVILKNAGKEEH